MGIIEPWFIVVYVVYKFLLLNHTPTQILIVKEKKIHLLRPQQLPCIWLIGPGFDFQARDMSGSFTIFLYPSFYNIRIVPNLWLLWSWGDKVHTPNSHIGLHKTLSLSCFTLLPYMTQIIHRNPPWIEHPDCVFPKWKAQFLLSSGVMTHPQLFSFFLTCADYNVF